MGDLYLKHIKNILRNSVESGMLNPEQQWAMIDETLDKLLVYLKDNEGVVQTVTLFESENDKWNKQIVEAQQKIAENYKNIYEHIISDKIG